jgi:hypothetical protein
MIVYLKDEIPDAELAVLMDKVRQYFGEPTYVDRKQAWQELSDQIGDPDLLSGVEDNPLPASIRVRLKPELLGFAAMEQAAQQVLEFPEVEDVRYGAEYVRRLDRFSGGVRLATWAVGAVVALAMALVLFNTLRLTVMARRHQVEVMLRLGASDRFIATPYVYEAMMHMTLAAVVSLLLVFALQAGGRLPPRRGHVPAVDDVAGVHRWCARRGLGGLRRGALEDPEEHRLVRPSRPARARPSRRPRPRRAGRGVAAGAARRAVGAGQSRGREAPELEMLRRQAQEKRAQAGALKGQETRALGELKRTEKELSGTRRRLRSLRFRSERLDQQLELTRANLQRSAATLQQQRARLAKRLRRMYMEGPARELEFLISTRSFAGLMMRWDFLQMLAEQDRLLWRACAPRRSASRRTSCG